MDVEHVAHRGPPPTADEMAARLRAEARGVHSWSNGPHDCYAEHDHPYRKVLYCVRGSIEFMLPGLRASGASAGSEQAGRRITMKPGDRLVIPPRTRHGAVVGPEGCTCIEGQT